MMSMSSGVHAGTGQGVEGRERPHLLGAVAGAGNGLADDAELVDHRLLRPDALRGREMSAADMHVSGR